MAKESSSTTHNQTLGGSTSSTTSGSTSTTSSSTDTTSNTHTEGGSYSVTKGKTYGESSSVGGSKTKGSGVSWASGEVSDKTQSKFNDATQDYVRSQNVEDAYANLQNALNSRPSFQSKFEDQLTSMYEKIMNRPGFSYDFNKDAMYQQYKDMYQTQGKRAMQDTMGQLAAMNNGYGSSYSQTAGQQTYQNYLQELNNRIPELRQMARDEYDREEDRLMRQYQLTNDAYNREYGQYRDTVSDWQSDRSFNQSAYQDERNFDYQKAQDDRAFWAQEYWNEKNQAHSNTNESESSNWNNTKSHSTSESETASLNWSDSTTHSHSDTTSTTNTSGWSNTVGTNWSISDGSSSSSSMGSSGGSRSSGVAGASAIPYSQSASLPAFSANNRDAQIDQLADMLNHVDSNGQRHVNQNEIGKMVVDLLDNGTKVGSGKKAQTVTYDTQSLANMFNEADARNNSRPIDTNGDGLADYTPPSYHTNNYTARDIQRIYEEYSGKNGKKNKQYWG